MSVFAFDTLRRTIDGTWCRHPAGAEKRYVSGVGIDSREDLAGRAFFAIRGDAHDGHDYLAAAVDAGAVILVIDREVDPDSLPPAVGVIRVDCTRRALARLALAHRRTLATTKVIAITGSSGKTTTKRLIHCILSQAMTGTCAVRSFNNDIGVPLTILAARPGDRYVVVEVGTNAPGEISALAAIAEPDIAVLINIGRAHLEGLGTVEDVAREKASLLSHLREGGTAVINADCLLLREYLKLASNVVLFGETEAADLRLTDRGTDPEAFTPSAAGTSWFEVNARQRFTIALPGRHNALNALAAIAVARRLGVSDAHIESGLRAAEPEPMRMAVERIGPITLINDAYNANPDSVIASLRTFGEVATNAERRVIVLGEMLELGPAAEQLHREVGRAIWELHQQQPIGCIILVGDLVRHVQDELAKLFPIDRLIHMARLTDRALDEMVARFAPGDAILIKGSRRVGLERLAERLGALSTETSHSASRRDAAIS